jgi:hypothetical protein
MEREWKKIREPLSDAAFHSNWRSSHRCDPLPRRRGSVGVTVAQSGRQEKSQISYGDEMIPKVVIR